MKTTPETIDWIDVKKDRPDVERTVLVYVPAADEPVWFGYLDEDDSGEQWFWADGQAIDQTVTHWAEMPAGPGGGK